MIDLHTHSLFSDGALLPSELVYRAAVRGYSAIAITDHGDFSNFDFIIPRIRRLTGQLSRHYGLLVMAGIEITYVPPGLIRSAVAKCRKLGASIVVVHGETPAETVPPGTNAAAIASGADILAHPGYISDNEAMAASKKKICLEITTRNGHNKTNRHVAERAKKYGAKLVLDTDSHEPENLLDRKKIKDALRMSGLAEEYYAIMQKNARAIMR